MKCNFVPPPAVERLSQCIKGRHHGAKDCDDEVREAELAMQENGYEFIGEGMFRSTYQLNPKCVVKIAKGYRGSRHQLTELYTWRMIRNTKKKNWIEMFAPVISAAPNGTWLVMANVPNPHTIFPQTPEWRERVRESNEELRKRGLFCDDLHGGNWGLHKNKMIAIDYGFGCTLKPKKEKTIQLRGETTLTSQYRSRGGGTTTFTPSTVEEFLEHHGTTTSNQPTKRGKTKQGRISTVTVVTNDAKDAEHDMALWKKFKSFVLARGGKFVEN